MKTTVVHLSNFQAFWISIFCLKPVSFRSKRFWACDSLNKTNGGEKLSSKAVTKDCVSFALNRLGSLGE